MPGPAPKPAEERRNTAKPRSGEWIDLPEEGKFKPMLPALPARMPDGSPWPQATRKAYKSWREDPASSQYSKAEVNYALETAVIHAYWDAAPLKYEKALVARLDKLGLTPTGKRTLRYRLPAYKQAVEKAETNIKKRKASAARRARVSVIEGGRSGSSD